MSSSLTVAWSLLSLVAPVQAPEPRPPAALQRALGEVTQVDAAAGQLGLKTDTGEVLTVRTDEKTSFVRAQPGARDLAGAAPTTLAEIAVGDRVLARGALAAEQHTLDARQVVVMARTDIAERHQQEEADWRRRGVSGVITAIDATRQEITVEVRSLAASRPVTVSMERPPVFKRYAPESVRFTDAKPSAFADLQVGDQVRVLGERTPDGARVVAEQVVSGAFQIVSGAVKTVEGRTVTIVDHETGKPLQVALSPDAMIRRLPPEMAARLALRNRGAAANGPGGGGPGAGGWQGRRAGAGPGGPPSGGEARAGGPPGAGGERPEGGAPPAGGPPPGGAPPEGGAYGRRMGGPGGGAPTLHEMLERLPALPLEQLKPGDQVAISSSKSSGAPRLTAFVLLAGIEPLLEARPRGAGGGGETLGLAAGVLDAGLGVP